MLTEQLPDLSLTRDLQAAPGNMPGKRGGIFLFFGVVLPLLALLFETSTRFCAQHFFDPFPSVWHVLLFLIIPASNFATWLAGRFDLSPFYLLMSLGNGMALGIGFLYALMFLPLSAFASLALLFFGFGLLAFAPLLSLPCSFLAGKSICNLASRGNTFFNAHQMEHLGHLIVLVMVVAVELPSTLTRMHLSAAVEKPTARQAIQWLRRYGNEEVMLRACYERSGRATDILGSLYEHAHPITVDQARAVFYKVTGKPFNAVPIPASARATIKRAYGLEDPDGLNAGVEDEFDYDADIAGETVSGVARGVSVKRSRLTGTLHPDALVGKLQWRMWLENNHKYDREARCRILLPPGAAVTRASLTVDGITHDATIMVRSAARAYYQQAVRQKKNPLLVSACGQDLVLVQCFPVRKGKDIELSLHLVTPLKLADSLDKASLILPAFAERNFQCPDPVEIDITADRPLAAASKAIVPTAGHSPDKRSDYRLLEIDIRADRPPAAASKATVPTAGHSPDRRSGLRLLGKLDAGSLAGFESVIIATRNAKCRLSYVEDRDARDGQAIAQIARPERFPLPKRLSVIVDGSAPMQSHIGRIAEALQAIPPSVEVEIVLVGDENLTLCPAWTSRLSNLFDKALSDLVAFKPAGGQDNVVIVDTVRRAAGKPGTAVLWIHAAQPVGSPDLTESLKQSLRQAGSRPLLYDCQIAAGPNEYLSFPDSCPSLIRIPRQEGVGADLERIFQSWLEQKLSSVAAQTDERFVPYRIDLERRIKRAWFPPEGSQSRGVFVVFKIDKQGQLSHLRLEKSSGVAAADQAALRAVENAAPFRPLPATAPDDMDVRFHFDYSLFRGGGRAVLQPVSDRWIESFPNSSNLTDDAATSNRTRSVEGQAGPSFIVGAGIDKDAPGSTQAPQELAQLFAYTRILELLASPEHTAHAAACRLAEQYHIVSPVSSAVVVEDIPALLGVIKKPAPARKSTVLEFRKSFGMFQVDLSPALVGQLNSLNMIKERSAEAPSTSPAPVFTDAPVSETPEGAVRPDLDQSAATIAVIDEIPMSRRLQGAKEEKPLSEPLIRDFRETLPAGPIPLAAPGSTPRPEELGYARPVAAGACKQGKEAPPEKEPALRIRAAKMKDKLDFHGMPDQAQLLKSQDQPHSPPYRMNQRNIPQRCLTHLDDAGSADVAESAGGKGWLIGAILALIAIIARLALMLTANARRPVFSDAARQVKWTGH